MCVCAHVFPSVPVDILCACLSTALHLRRFRLAERCVRLAYLLIRGYVKTGSSGHIRLGIPSVQDRIVAGRALCTDCCWRFLACGSFGKLQVSKLVGSVFAS